MQIETLSPHIGAEVRGVDIGAPMADEVFAQLRQTLEQHGVLVLRDQRLDKQGMVAFTGRFGPLEGHVLSQWLSGDTPAIMVLSNFAYTKNGEPSDAEKTARFWHSDLSFMARPALATALYAVEAPDRGGNTEFNDMCAACDALAPERKARLAGLAAVHDLDYCQHHIDQPPLTDAQREAAPPVAHAMVRTHTPTGRSALYLSPLHTSHVVGLAEDESRELLTELFALATRSEFTYSHRWQPGDYVIWDNRRLLHRGTPYDTTQRRLLWRATVSGETVGQPCPASASTTKGIHAAA
jgi:taurine dioxygenase